ncbi:MAG: hypothetical protein KGJ88_04555 [Verrucomicrobiota bacterium]|nr:hypothetical protein [Verrucomicrobiota bacterium]
MKTIVVLVGVRGCGKSTLIATAKSFPLVHVLQPSTTRGQRPDDDGQYHHQEKKHWNKNDFAWTIEVAEHFYGLRKSELESIKSGEIGFTVFHPGNLKVLHDYRATSPLEFITVGLDNINSYEEQIQRIQGDKLRDEGQAAFNAQRLVAQSCDVVLHGDFEVTKNALSSIFIILKSRGILDKQSITNLIRAGTLLKDALTDNIQPASYDLTVGGTVWCKGKLYKLTAHEPITIPPYSYVLVEAHEKACLPNFVVAHYDIKVSLFIQGVILSNGPQVDPGFDKILLCMLFNGSDSNIGLKLGEHFATMEFLVTTKVTEKYHEHHQGHKTLADYMPGVAVVGPGGTIVDRLSRVENTLNGLWLTLVVPGLAVIVAVI